MDYWSLIPIKMIMVAWWFSPCKKDLVEKKIDEKVNLNTFSMVTKL